MKFDRGYISPYFVTDSKTQMCEMENPIILIVEKKVRTVLLNFNSIQMLFFLVSVLLLLACLLSSLVATAGTVSRIYWGWQSSSVFDKSHTNCIEY